MKGDFSRRTFDAKRHYSAVRMQQGRVLLDADWNEQADIIGHRIETEARDTIGRCGAPLDDAAFGIVLDAGLPAGDFRLTAGRFYVDGILVENEEDRPYSGQPHLESPPMVGAPGLYVVYLDVWRRHITALDDPDIREVALGGPDTTTRVQTVWQVRVWNAGEVEGGCGTDFEGLADELAPSSGLLSAATVEPPDTTEPCEIPPTAGYRGRENQLYRVEVHRPGPVGDMTFKWSRDNGSIVTRVTAVDAAAAELTVADLGRDAVRGFAPGLWVELIDDDRELAGDPGELVRVLSVDPVRRRLTVEDPGGVLAAQPDPATTLLKLRRWDHVGGDGDGLATGPAGADFTVELEHGIQVTFYAPDAVEGGGEYRTGDYWLIPARTANADAASGGIEWPRQGLTPSKLLPAGIRHHYCRLGMLRWDGAAFQPFTGDALEGDPRVEDCRPLFPPATELVQLEYLGGDGQEAMPDLLAEPPPRVELAAPLRVGVLNGGVPVADAPVRFRLVPGTGDGRVVSMDGLTEDTAIVVRTGADGVAECRWRLDPATVFRTQRVEAALLESPGDVGGAATDAPPVVFTANLSLAAEVAYDSREGCPALAGVDDVQQAIETLCSHLNRFYYLGGDGQEVARQGAAPYALPAEIRVGVSHGTLPVDGAEVRFEVLETDEDGNPVGPVGDVHDADQPPGTAAPAVTVATAGGVARVRWRLGASAARQRLQATLVDNPNGLPPIIFTAGLLPETGRGCVDLVLEPGDDLQAALDGVPRDRPLCVCLRPGEYRLPAPLLVERDNRAPVALHGCGPATRLLAPGQETAVRFERCGAVSVRDLTARTTGTTAADLRGTLTFVGCDAVDVEGVRLQCGRAEWRRVSCLRVEGQGLTTVRIVDCELTVGYEQVGVLLTNVRSAHVEGNTIRGGVGKAIPLENRLGDPHHRGAVRQRFMDRIAIADPQGEMPDRVRRGRFDPPPTAGRAIVDDLRVGGRLVRFETDPLLVREWRRFLAQRPLPPGQRPSARDIRRHLNEAADAMLTEAGRLYRQLPPNLPPELLAQQPGHVRLYAFLDGSSHTHGAQGVVVGGSLAPDLRAIPRGGDAALRFRVVVAGNRLPEVRVLDNRITGFVQGVHLALSGGAPRDRRRHLRLFRVHVAGNTIGVLRPETIRERHGLYVGSVQSATLRDNLIEVLNATYGADGQLGGLAIDGIRVHGSLGPLVVIQGNHIAEFTTGIFLRALNFNEAADSVWRLTDNATPGALQPQFTDPPGL